MAVFMHVFAADDQKKIERNGLRPTKTSWRRYDGVFVMPVVPNYEVTHQWFREVQRFRNVPKMAVRLRLPDEEPIWVGRYNEDHLTTTAAEAVRIVLEHVDPMGLEVVVPRRIRASELLGFYHPPKAVGWRYHPKAKGTKPCGCPVCQYSQPYGRKLRDAYDRANRVALDEED